VEQLGLQRRFHLGDFIQEDCAGVRLLELADARGGRAGERAFSCPKSSLSSSSAGSAAQLTFTNGRSLREER